MTTTPAPADSRRSILVAALVAATLAVLVLLWSKWLPYGEKVGQLAGKPTWSGGSILSVGNVHPGDAPSWHAAVSFTVSYAAAVWKALVAALLISAAVQSLVPRGWLLWLLDRPGRVRSAAVAGLVSMPSMMCTCCTAPVAVGLRRQGVPTSAAVAYWLGNPLLNPAVLVFLAFVAPWQWFTTRLVVGAALVVGGAALTGWLADRHRGGDRAPAAAVVEVSGGAATSGRTGASGGGALLRFVRALVRTSVVLVPEYLVVVMLVGGLRGWVFPVGSATALGPVLVAVLASVVGTLVVIPTAGEIPILQGLALAGLSAGALGALLITLPAVSLPGIAMVGRAFGWRATTVTASVVVGGGLIGGLLFAVLTLSPLGG